MKLPWSDEYVALRVKALDAQGVEAQADLAVT